MLKGHRERIGRQYQLWEVTVGGYSGLMSVSDDNTKTINKKNLSRSGAVLLLKHSSLDVQLAHSSCALTSMQLSIKNIRNIHNRNMVRWKLNLKIVISSSKCVILSVSCSLI